jgi:hypothetical protein
MMIDDQMAGSTSGICKPKVAAAKPPSIVAVKAIGHAQIARPPLSTPQRPTATMARMWSAPLRG